MTKHNFISLYAAVQAHKAEFELAVITGALNAVTSMSLEEIKEAFTPNRLQAESQLQKAA